MGTPTAYISLGSITVYLLRTSWDNQPITKVLALRKILKLYDLEITISVSPAMSSVTFPNSPEIWEHKIELNN